MKQSNVKTFVFRLCLCLVLTLSLCLSASAQNIPSGIIFKPATQNTFCVGATNNGATIPIAWCTISALSLNGGVPVVTGLVAGSNTNATTQTYAAGTNGYTGAVVAWRIVDQTQANYTNTTTSVPVTATNSFASGDLILVRHMTTDDYERLSLTTATSGTNLTLLAQSAESILPGDIIYRLSATNAAVVAATTNMFSGGAPGNSSTLTFAGPRLLCGQKGLPLLLSIQGLTSAEILSAAGYYETDIPVTKTVLGP